jgi:hypothetical protein
VGAIFYDRSAAAARSTIGRHAGSTGSAKVSRSSDAGA